MSVGFVRIAPSFQALLKGLHPENSEKEKLMEEYLPPEQSPDAKNREFQSELTGLWFGYRYSYLRFRSVMTLQHIFAKGLMPQYPDQLDPALKVIATDLIKLVVTPSMIQLKEMIEEMRRFEDRIVVLIEEENPPPRVDTIQELHNCVIERFK